MKTALLMLSGGLDSSFVLHHLLTQTDYNIVTHHISHRYDGENRWEQEDIATNAVVSYCKEHYRGFRHTTSVFDFRGFGHVGWDSDMQVMVAAKVAPNLKGLVTVVIGWTQDDMDRPIVQSRMERKCTSNLWTVCRNSIDSRKLRRRLNPKIWMPLVDMKYYKADIIRECPKEIIDLTWSCRKPVKGEPCGRCLPCKQLENLTK